MKISIYLAGKIDHMDWRHELVPDLRDHPFNGGPLHTKHFIYTGPFFISCDHGCFHGPNKHGARREPDGGCSDEALTQPEIIHRSFSAILRSDLVFAYITENDCYGTISEITWGVCLRKPVVIAFAPGVNARDFWFIEGQVLRAHENVTLQELPDLLITEIAKIKTTLMLGGARSFGNYFLRSATYE